MKDTHKVIVIGSGIGGGATARRLAENGVKVLLVERGEWVPREADNWTVASVFFTKKDTWLDASGSQRGFVLRVARSVFRSGDVL
jgi:choline dehydrogenase-like flavoprotein